MRRDERDEGLLRDMLKACREAQDFMQGASVGDFLEDRRLALAVERCLEIVGEAAGRMSPGFRNAHPEIPWQRIRGLRNILAHDYGFVDSDAIYNVAKDDVPVLAATLDSILGGWHSSEGGRRRYNLTKRSIGRTVVLQP